MKSLPTPFLLFVIAAAFLAGCSGPSNTTVGLKVELTRIAVANGATQVTWRVLNPNLVPYLIGESSHRVYLDGTLVGSLQDREALAIPSQSTQERTTALVPAGAAAERALAAAVAAGSANYRVEMNVLVRLYGDTTEKGELRAQGTVPVSSK